MPRDSNGAYSLPTGNPVTTLTVISSTWANTTLSDISTALTESLDRSGQGAMLAGLKLFDGIIGAPGLTWGTETNSGLFRNAAGDFRYSISATELLQLTSNLLRISGSAPIIRWNESDAAANNRLWDVIASGEDMNFRVLTDALAATNWMTIARTAGAVDSITLIGTTVAVTGAQTVSGIATFNALGGSDPSINISSARPILRWTETGVTANNTVWQMDAEAEAFRAFVSNDLGTVSTVWMQVERTANTVDSINFAATLLNYNSREIGYRQLLVNTKSSNFSFTDAERGMIYRISTGTLTVTIDTTLTTNSVYTIVNDGGGAATIQGSGVTIQWFNGTGTVSSGSRALAVAGVATVWMVNNTTAYIWGAGLS